MHGSKHHISQTFRPGIRFALFRVGSPLLTESRLISFPPPTKMFQFGGFPFSNENDPNGSGGPIRRSPDQRLLAPTRSNIAAWHVLRRLPSRAIPQVAWICRVLATQSSGMRMIRQSSAISADQFPCRLRPVPLRRRCATIAGCMVVPLTRLSHNTGCGT